jgi:signal peptidase I
VWPIFAQHEPGAGGIQQTIDNLARTPLSQIVVFVAACTLVRISIYTYLRKTPAHHRHGLYPLAKFLNEAMDAIVYAGVFVFMLIRPFAVQAFLIPSGSMLQTLYLNDFIVANKAIYRYSEPKVGDIIVFKPPLRALDDLKQDVDFIKRCQGIPGDVVQVVNGKLVRNGKPVIEPYLSNSMGNGNPAQSGADVQMATDWKLIHYVGKARPDLYDQYFPVQIRRDAPETERYNYKDPAMICRLYAVGAGDEESTKSAVRYWKERSSFTPKEEEFEREIGLAPPAAVPKGFVLMMGDNRDNSYDGRAWGLVAREDVIGRSEFIWLPISRWRITR